MPYNTRRKSLSLTELGIVVPKRSRTQSHPSPPTTIVETDEAPPSKKSKRSPASSASPPPPVALQRTAGVRIRADKPKIATAAPQLSPPPSPDAEPALCANRVDVEGIRDDIVVATIRQLERSGNRPHLVKELAAILMARLASVEKYGQSTSERETRLRAANNIGRSSNPCALISSRLTAYLGRAWPAVSPCPLAKALSSSHPRRLYFHLTTMPRQPIPDFAERMVKDQRVITPSLSSGSPIEDEDEDADGEHHMRQRQALSPSPEVDLSAPELDEDEDSEQRAPEPPTPGAPFSGRSSVARERSESTSAAASLAHGGRREASPQLEREEFDFKQTASALLEEAQRQKTSREQAETEQRLASTSLDNDMNTSASDTSAAQLDNSFRAPEQRPEPMELDMDAELECDERAHEQSRKAAAALFGHDHLKVGEAQSSLIGFSSPIIAPRAQTIQTSDMDPIDAQPAESDSTAMEVDVDDSLPNGTDAVDVDMTAQRGSTTAAASASTLRCQPDLVFSDDADDWAASLRSPETVGLHELDDLFDAY